MGIGPGDCPPFHGIHESSALVAGGSIGAVETILAGDAVHAFNPGGGLHHAMAARASGFCIYNDVALGVAAARDAGHRVLYVDLDVHHGDGTQALFADDPDVLTFSIHESGRSLFPGTGDVDEIGGPAAPGTAVNIPLDPYSGDASWLAAVESALPALAAAFRPTFLVSQHGCDSHVFDPLAHLRLTTAAYVRATRLLDWHRARVVRGSLAGDGRRRLRRVSGGATVVGADLAGPGAPGRAGGDARGLAGALVRGGGSLSTGTAAGRVPGPGGSGRGGTGGMGERNARTAARSVSQALELLGRALRRFIRHVPPDNDRVVRIRKTAPNEGRGAVPGAHSTSR